MEPEDAFSLAYTRFEIEMNYAHRRIEALERENAELRIKNHRLMRDLALAQISRVSAEGTPQSSASQTPPPSSQGGGAADADAKGAGSEESQS